MSDDRPVRAQEVKRTAPIVGARRDEIINTFFAGFGVAIVVTGLAALLDRFVFNPLLCDGGSSGACENVDTYSMLVSMLLGALGGLITMTTLQVYRPLLVVLASTIALWGYNSMLMGMVWYWTLLISVVLFGLTYALFAWIARIRSFILAVIISLVMIVLVRLMIAL